MARSQFEEALLTHKSLILGWMRDFSQQSNVNVHELSGGLHTGGLSDAQAPQFLKLDGSRQLSGNLSVLDGVTIDGVDLSAIDHGTLVGLGDDDHTQYFNVSRHTLLVHTNLGLVPNTRQIISGDGISGGGDLTADRTLAIGAGTGINVGANSVAINLAANLTWTGNHVFQGGLSTRHLLPELTDTYDLGSSLLLWRKGWLSELDSILFAQNTVTLLGGWLLITKDEGALAGDVLAADTTIDFGKGMTVGDFVLMRASLKMEYMQVGTLVSGTTYNVTRNLDGSGANDWPGGTPFAVLGTSGNGRIELNAYDTPRISIIEQGATYNAQTERIRIGDLTSWQSAGLSGYGMAMGDYSSGEYLTYSPPGGLVVRGTIRADDGYLENLTVQGLLNLSTAGELRAGDTSNGLRFGYLSDGYYLRGVGGGITQVEIRASDGKLYAGSGNVKIDANGITLTALTTVPGSPGSSPSEIKWTGGSGLSAQYNPDTGVTGLHIQNYWDGGTSAGVSISAKTSSGYSGIGVGSESSSFSGRWYPWIVWTSNNTTPTYTSEYSITFSNVNVTNFFPVGTRIKFTQTTVKYFIVVASSFSTHTVLTLNGGGIYSVANATITDLRYSHAAVSYGMPFGSSTFIPLTTPLTSTSYDGGDTIGTGTTNIDTSAVFGAPAGIKGVMVQISGQWSSANNGYYAALRPKGGSTNVIIIRAQVASIASDMTGFCPCDANGDLDLVVAGASINNTVIRIHGYYI